MTTPLKTKPTLINNKNLKGIKLAFQVFFLRGLFPFFSILYISGILRFSTEKVAEFLTFYPLQKAAFVA